MSNTTPIDEKIRLLLKKAESTDSEHEREALSSAAEKLMLKHGIELAMLDLDRDQTVKEEIVSRQIILTGIYSMQEMNGLYEIAKSFKLGCFYTDWRRFNKTIVLTVVGFERDVDDALIVMNSLRVQAAVALKNWWPTAKRTVPANDGYKARREFVQYFHKGAASRIRQSRTEVIAEAGEKTALVLVDREQQVAASMSRFGLKSAKNRTTITGYGTGAGYSAGKNANTGGRGIAAGQRSIGR